MLIVWERVTDFRRVSVGKRDVREGEKISVKVLSIVGSYLLILRCDCYR